MSFDKAQKSKELIFTKKLIYSEISLVKWNGEINMIGGKGKDYDLLQKIRIFIRTIICKTC